MRRSVGGCPWRAWASLFGTLSLSGTLRRGVMLRACRSDVHDDFVGFQVLCRESRRRWIVLFPDAGRSCPDCDGVHLLAGFPQRNDDDLAGLGVGEQVITFEPGHLAGAGQLLLGQSDGAVESLGPCLGCD